MKVKFIFSIVMIAIFIIGCKKKDAPFDRKELLTIQGNLLTPSSPTYLFLTNREGKVITCEEHTGTDLRILTNKIPMDDDYFDFSIVRSINSAQNILKIETHPNVKITEWQFKNQYTGTLVNTSGNITFLADDLVDDIEYALIDGFNGSLSSMSELKTTGSQTIKYNFNENFIFLRFKMIDEEQYRYVEFNNLTDGDTITLDIASYPLAILEDIQSNGVSEIRIKNLTGLRVSNSFENSSEIYNHNIFIQDYILPNGKVYYPDGIFDSFFVRLEMKKDSFQYLMENMGAPIYEYNPIPPELILEGDKTKFRVKSNGVGIDFVSVTWTIEKSVGFIEWTVFHQVDETDFFTLPELPDCLLFNQSWFSPDEFKLKSMQSYHYQNFESYEQYINSRYGNEEGGVCLKLIKVGGNFEQKSVMK